MFETLKKKMILDESKKVSENALAGICEDFVEDNLLEETILFQESTAEDDSTLEAILDEIPEDDEMSEEILDEQNDFIEEFIEQDLVARKRCDINANEDASPYCEDLDLL